MGFLTETFSYSVSRRLNQWVDQYLWPMEQVLAPEFGYPRKYRQLRLKNSLNNQKWLSHANTQMQWLKVCSDHMKPMPISAPKIRVTEDQKS